MNKKFLDSDGLRALLVLLDGLIDTKTQLNMVSTIDEDSTNQQIPGAKAVYDLLTDALAGIVKISMEVVTELPQISDADTSVVYLVQEDAAKNRYRQWILAGDQWFDLGIAEIDLLNYWAKNELEAMTNAEIQTIFDEVMGV